MDKNHADLFNSDYADMARALLDAGAEFMLVGGYAVERNVNGMAFKILGIAELIRNKRATGRSKDAADADVLEKLAEVRK